MASTFSPNKTLELPGFNDYVNSWNTPLNSDMTIIDTALGGSTLLNATSPTGNVTLTYSQYRPLSLIVSGAMSANVSYIVPAGVGGQWTVTNNTSGAFSVFMVSAAGGSSIKIPQGYSTIVSCDGSSSGMRISVSTALAAGSSTQVQYNSNGLFAGASNFTFNGSTVSVPSLAATGNMSVSGQVTAVGPIVSSAGGLSIAGNADFGGYVHCGGDIFTTSSIASNGNITTNGQSFQIGTGQANAKNLVYYNSSRVVALYLDTSANFGLSDTTGGFTRWYSSTNGDFNVYGTLYQGFSDARLKANIAPISDALAKVNRINGVTFNANELAGGFGYKDTKAQAGVLAHEIEAVLPEAVAIAPFDADHKDGAVVSKSGENYKTVQYEKLVPLLIEAIKELTAKVEALEARG
jgi:hypothetical protein